MKLLSKLTGQSGNDDKKIGEFFGLRELTLFSGGNFIAQFIMMVYAVLVARLLGPEKLGIYSGLYAILGVSITFVNFGLDLWMLKEAHTQSSLRELTGKVMQIKLLLGTVWGVACLVFLPITGSGHFTVSLVLLGIGDVFADVLLNTLITSWNIQRRVKRINIFLLLSRTGKLLLLFVLAWLQKVDPSTVMLTRFVVSTIILSFALSISKPKLSKIHLGDSFGTLRKAAAFGYSEILAMIYANIDVAILSYFSITNTGLYSPASGIVHALFVIPTSVHAFLLPQFTKMIFTGELNTKRHLYHLLVSLFLAIGITLTISVFTLGPVFATHVLGGNFVESGNIMRLLSPILLFKSISLGLAVIIIAEGLQKKRLIPQLVVAFLTVVLNLIFIPRFGVTSVALIYLLGEFFLMVGYLVIILRNRNEEKANN